MSAGGEATPPLLAPLLAPLHGKVGPMPCEGTLMAADREAIFKATGCSAAVRARPPSLARSLTISGPVSALASAHEMALAAIAENAKKPREKTSGGSKAAKGSRERQEAAKQRRRAHEERPKAAAASSADTPAQEQQQTATPAQGQEQIATPAQWQEQTATPAQLPGTPERLPTSQWGASWGTWAEAWATHKSHWHVVPAFPVATAQAEKAPEGVRNIETSKRSNSSSSSSSSSSSNSSKKRKSKSVSVKLEPNDTSAVQSTQQRAQANDAGAQQRAADAKACLAQANDSGSASSSFRPLSSRWEWQAHGRYVPQRVEVPLPQVMNLSTTNSYTVWCNQNPFPVTNLDAAMRLALMHGWPTWHTPGTGGTFPLTPVHNFAHDKLAHGARIDFFRGTQANDLLNVEWSALYNHCPTYQAYMREHQNPLSVNSRGNAMESAAGVSYAAATHERFLHGSFLKWASEGQRAAWGEVWPRFQALDLVLGGSFTSNLPS